MHGIILGRGPELKRGATVAGARIIDYAPTILHSFGVEIPSDMDGRALEEIFTEEYMGKNPVRISEADHYVEPEKAGAMTDEESDEIRERLRGWGYLG
jgi:arylsulfatase A-like enzyme